MEIKHNRCAYCRRAFDEGKDNLKRTRDHFIPKSRTGKNEENILPCCHECNEWKADKMPELWLGRVLYFENKRRLYGTYTLFDYRHIIGSIRHWQRHFKGKKICDYKY